MWCVADLNDDYIDKMEDVLKTYERPYDAAQPVVCLDEKPGRATRRRPSGLAGQTGAGSKTGQ